MDDDATFCKRCGKATLAPTGAPMPEQSAGTVPSAGPAPVEQAAQAGCGCSPWVMWTAIGLVVLAVVLGAIGGGSSSDEATREGAFDVCTQFVEDRLRAPGTARFPNQFQDDGEVVITSTGADSYRVTSFVDAENAFGGEVRTPFVCEVRYTGDDNWRLVSLSLEGG